MKNFWMILIACHASPIFAENVSMYENADAFIADLKQMAIRCGGMKEGQVDQEIFGLQFSRVGGDRCILGSGEIDPIAHQYLSANDLNWAGLEGVDSIWVLARPN